MKIFSARHGTATQTMGSVFLVTTTFALASVAGADEFRAQADGVTFRVRAFRDAVVLCIRARQDLKISSEYGVQFQVDPGEARLWNENFPKTVTGPGWYFGMPLRIELRTRGDVRQHQVDVNLGACSDTTLCNEIRIRITVPSYKAQSKTAEECSD